MNIQGIFEEEDCRTSPAQRKLSNILEKSEIEIYTLYSGHSLLLDGWIGVSKIPTLIKELEKFYKEQILEDNEGE